jgi:hypothetical protein
VCDFSFFLLISPGLVPLFLKLVLLSTVFFILLRCVFLLSKVLSLFLGSRSRSQPQVFFWVLSLLFEPKQCTYFRFGFLPLRVFFFHQSQLQGFAFAFSLLDFTAPPRVLLLIFFFCSASVFHFGLSVSSFSCRLSCRVAASVLSSSFATAPVIFFSARPWFFS